MNLTGQHTISAPPERVFEVLTDPECLKHVMPGCEKLEAVRDGVYELSLSAGVGPIKGSYAGTVHLEDVTPPSSYRMIVDVKGKTGFVKGEGEVSLEAEGEGTRVFYTGKIAIGGPLAAVGQRMHSSASKMMTRQLFGAIDAEANAEPGEEVKHGLIRDVLRGMRRGK